MVSLLGLDVWEHADREVLDRREAAVLVGQVADDPLAPLGAEPCLAQEELPIHVVELCEVGVVLAQ
eukprot:358230-Pyramimonas_sp.AAC.1